MAVSRGRSSSLHQMPFELRNQLALPNPPPSTRSEQGRTLRQLAGAWKHHLATTHPHTCMHNNTSIKTDVQSATKENSHEVCSTCAGERHAVQEKEKKLPTSRESRPAACDTKANSRLLTGQSVTPFAYENGKHNLLTSQQSGR